MRPASIRQGELHRRPGVRTLVRTIFCVFDFLEPCLALPCLSRQITLMKRSTERRGKTVGRNILDNGVYNVTNVPFFVFIGKPSPSADLIAPFGLFLLLSPLRRGGAALSALRTTRGVIEKGLR